MKKVDKKVLREKSDAELYTYLRPDSQYVSTAVKYAYEILKERDRSFSDEEVQLIDSLMQEKKYQEDIIVGENYKKAANILYVSGAIALLFFFVNVDLTAGISNIIAQLFPVCFVFVLALLVSKGFDWVKYVFVCCMSLTVLGSWAIIWVIFNSPVDGVIFIIQTILQIWATVLLFRDPIKGDIVPK